MPVPKQKQGRIRTHTRRSANMKISAAAQSTCPRCQASAPRVPQLRFLQGPRGYRYRVTVYSGCDAVPNGTTMAGSMSRLFLYKEHVYE